MKKILISKEYLTNIANAIRLKSSNSNTYKPAEMAPAIEQITTIYAPRYISFREYKGIELTSELKNLDTSKLTTMAQMFYYCNALNKLDLSNFDTSNVNNMRYMFYGCSNLTSLDLSSFDTSKVADMSYMFTNCEKLMKLDIRKFNFNNVSNYINIFSGIPSNCTIIVADAPTRTWITNRFPNLVNVKIASQL